MRNTRRSARNKSELNTGENNAVTDVDNDERHDSRSSKRKREASDEDGSGNDRKNAKQSRKSNAGTVCKRGKYRKKKSLKNSVEVLIANVDVNEPIACAVCGKEMLEKEWKNHKLRAHNNLAWHSSEAPLDLNDKTLVINILTELYKKKFKFKCETCQAEKKSVLGFLSHQDSCNKSQEELEALRVKCELCERTMLPVSMSSHLRLMHGPKAEQVPGPVEEDRPLAKRQSAIRVTEILKAMKENEEAQRTEPSKKPALPTLNSLVLKNFSFQLTPLFKKHLRRRLKRDGRVQCKFEECLHESEAVKDLIAHMKSCEKRRSINRTCKVCYRPFEDEALAKQHVKMCRTVKAEDDDDSDASVTLELESPGKKSSVVTGNRKYQLELASFIPKQSNLNKTLYQPAHTWMSEFCLNNYAVPDLHARLTPKPWTTLEATQVANYLPLNKVSLQTARIVDTKFTDPHLDDSNTYKRFKLFEAQVFDEDGNAAVFCGGSITSVSWCPTPVGTVAEQIVAVATCLNPNEEPILVYRRVNKGLVQFWNLGALSLGDGDSGNVRPRLEFCLAHDFGYVYDMEWCPSGCYDDARLGLLAVACSDSHVYVYSVPQTCKVKGKVFKPEPSIRLALNLLDELNIGEHKYHATKVSWTKAKEHKYIAVGYSNGFVGLYDISSETLQRKEAIETIKPFKMVCAHIHAITALALHHMEDGRRWLMTGSTDRYNKFWDLQDPSQPIGSFRKSNITDGAWPLNWIGGITSQDDGTVTTINSSSYGQARDVGVNPPPFLYANSRINSVTVSDWGNIFVQGTSNGEIHASYPNQIFQNVDLEKSVRTKKFYVRRTVLLEKNLSGEERSELEKRKEEAFKCEMSKEMFRKSDVRLVPPELLQEPINYLEADKKYKMLIVDCNLESDKYITNDHVKHMGHKSKLLKPSRANQYPVHSVNNVALNPNKQSFLYLASGYRAGFLTVTYLKFLNKGYDKK